jgi:hypothetical protein
MALSRRIASAGVPGARIPSRSAGIISAVIAGGSCSLTAVTVAASSGSYAGAGPMRAASDAMVLLRRRCGRRRPAGSRRGRRRHRQSRGR